MVPARGNAADDWCGRRDSNPHILRYWNLNPARLPVPPRPHLGTADRGASIPRASARQAARATAAAANRWWRERKATNGYRTPRRSPPAAEPGARTERTAARDQPARPGHRSARAKLARHRSVSGSADRLTPRPCASADPASGDAPARPGARPQASKAAPCSSAPPARFTGAGAGTALLAKRRKPLGSRPGRRPSIAASTALIADSNARCV